MSPGDIVRRFGAEVASVSLIVAVVVVPVWPGVFTVDSQAMYKKVRLGEVDDWYAPILQSGWRLIEAIGLPTSTVLVGTSIVVVVALLAIYRLALGRTAAIVATAATVLFPPVYGLLGWIGRDVWFLALVLVVIASLGWASVQPAHRTSLVVVALVAAWFAADARQNGFPVLVVAAGVSAWLVLGTKPRRWLLVIGAGVVVVVAGLALQRGARAVLIEHDAAPEQVLYYQDLLALSLRLDESQVPRRLLPPDRLDDVRELWVPAQVGEVLFEDDSPVDFRPFSDDDHERRTALLRDAWIDTVTAHPFDYVVERADLYRRLLGVADDVPGAWYEVSDQVAWSGSPALAQRFPALNDARASVLELFDSGNPGFGGPLHRAWIYVLVGLAGAGAIVAADPRLRLFGVMLLALQVSLQLVLMFAATLLEYRFELFQVVLGIVAAVIGTRAVLGARQRASITPPVAAPPNDSTAAEHRLPDPTASRP